MGGFSRPGKMPGLARGNPATRSRAGSDLEKIDGTVCNACYAGKGSGTTPASTSEGYCPAGRVVEARIPAIECLRRAKGEAGLAGSVPVRGPNPIFTREAPAAYPATGSRLAEL